MIAWINGILGLTISCWIGTQWLGLSLAQMLLAVFWVVLAGWLALFLTTRAQSHPWIRRYLVRGFIRTWTFFLLIYFGTIYLTVGFLHDGKNVLYLIIPLVLSNGFSIIAFGPVQDWFVSREQRRKTHAHLI